MSLIPALLANTMGKARSAAFIANKNARFFERQVRPSSANLAFRMMFYRYATHVGYYVKIVRKTQKTKVAIFCALPAISIYRSIS